MMSTSNPTSEARDEDSENWSHKAATPDSQKCPVVHLDEVRKCFGDVEALAGLSLTVSAGEWIGLLGPNGAGKSTLMHSIAGLLPPDAGTLELFGTLVGFVPQEIALYPLLTAEENLDTFGRLHGLRGRELHGRVDWALEWTGLADRARHRTGTLSGGMQRRLNIACGVLHQPRLVLLDEPAVGVDPQGRQRIWEMLTELRDQGTALIQSTHELHEIESLCDRVLIMDHGRILAAGTVEELIAETLGEHAVLHIDLDQSALGRLRQNGFEYSGAPRGTTLQGTLTDVAAELPAVLAEVHSAGLGVRHLHVQRPSLEAVFTHLTGRELRE